jgi:hypothetical protein
MARNPEKVAGNKGPCFKCGKDMFCNEIEYQGEKKLQWQGPDGKSHYDKDGNCKGTSQQVSNTVQAIKTQKIKLEDIKLDIPILEKALQVSRSASQFLKAIEYVVYEELGQDAQPAHAGLYTKIIADKLLNVPNLQEILDNVGGKDE